VSWGKNGGTRIPEIRLSERLRKAALTRLCSESPTLDFAMDADHPPETVPLAELIGCPTRRYQPA